MISWHQNRATKTNFETPTKDGVRTDVNAEQKMMTDHRQQTADIQKRSCQNAPSDLEAEETERHEQSTVQSEVLDNRCQPVEKGIPKKEERKTWPPETKNPGFCAVRSIFGEQPASHLSGPVQHEELKKVFVFIVSLALTSENRYPDKT